MPTLSPVDLAIVAAYTLGMTLFGLSCGAVHWLLKGADGLTAAWLGRFAVAGLIAGVVVGVCAACDYAANAASFDGRESAGPAGREEVFERPAIPVDVAARRQVPHTVNGRK